MTLYIFIFVLILALSLLEIFTKNKKISLLTCLLMFFMAGSRYKIGYDFGTYESFFKDANNFENVFNGTVDAESGYLFLNYIFNKLGFNFNFFILFFSLFSIGLLTTFLYRNFPFPSMSLLYYYVRYFFVRDMGQIRSSIACIILLFAIPYMIEKKTIRFAIVVMIASLFHISALAFFLVYLFNHIIRELNLKNSFLLLYSAIIIGIVVQNPQIYLWAIPNRYIAYFTNPAYVNGQWIMNPVLWMQVAIFLASLMFVHFTSREMKNKQDAYLKVYFLASFVLIAAGTLGTVGGRISTLFATTEIIVVPYLFMNFTHNKILNIFSFYIFSFLIFLLIIVISGAYHSFTPYQSIFGL